VKVAPTECDLEQLEQRSDAAVAARVQMLPNGGLPPAPPDVVVNFGVSMWLDIIAQDRFVGAVLSPRIFPGLFLGVLANDIVIWF
jgi:hypothetical protein